MPRLTTEGRFLLVLGDSCKDSSLFLFCTPSQPAAVDCKAGVVASPPKEGLCARLWLVEPLCVKGRAVLGPSSFASGSLPPNSGDIDGVAKHEGAWLA